MDRKVIPISVPAIGGNQQPPFDISEAMAKSCSVCGGELFTPAVRLMMVPRLAPRNATGQDVLIKIEVFLCRSCGIEYGK